MLSGGNCINSTKEKEIKKMKSWKKAVGIAATVISVVVVGATFFAVTGTSSNDTVQIRLAHNQAKGS